MSLIVVIDVKQLSSLNWGLRFPIIFNRYHQLAVDDRMLRLVVPGLQVVSSHHYFWAEVASRSLVAIMLHLIGTINRKEILGIFLSLGI